MDKLAAIVGPVFKVKGPLSRAFEVFVYRLKVIRRPAIPKSQDNR